MHPIINKTMSVRTFVPIAVTLDVLGYYLHVLGMK